MKKFKYTDYLQDSYNKLWKKVYSSTKVSGARAACMTEGRKGQMPEHHITLQDIKDKYKDQKGLCYWSKTPLRLHYQKVSYHPLGVSVDRLENNKGYSKDNIVLCLRLINLGKNQYPSDEFPTVIEILKNDFTRKWWHIWA